jgi:hypothetical protein
MERVDIMTICHRGFIYNWPTICQTGESINQKDALKEPYRKKILSKTTQ